MAYQIDTVLCIAPYTSPLNTPTSSLFSPVSPLALLIASSERGNREKRGQGRADKGGKQARLTWTLTHGVSCCYCEKRQPLLGLFGLVISHRLSRVTPLPPFFFWLFKNYQSHLQAQIPSPVGFLTSFIFSGRERRRPCLCVLAGLRMSS